MTNILNSVFSKFSTLTKKRMNNTNRYKATNLILVLAFPFFLTALAETIQMKSINKFIIFLFEKPSVVLFNIILILLMFSALLLLFKKAYIAASVLGIGITTVAVVELFKFNTSGNHLILSELSMAVNLESMTRFAYIKITPQLVTCVLLLFLYLFFVYYFNPVVRIKRVKRFLSSGICFAAVALFVATPSVAIPVYSFFEIDTTATDNVFRLNEKFNNNNLIAFLAQTTTESISKKIEEPDGYDIEAVAAVLDDYIPESENGSFKNPNVIIIMSEAFTDFRVFDELEVSDEAYAAFDRIRNDGFSGNAIVPTFGSFTVKTEFELMVGLPVKSLNDPNMPQRLMLDREQQTVASYFDSLGYNTNYIHTFLSSFYGRDTIYSNYGFDNMYFDDSLTVPLKYYKSYISDTTIFNQMSKILTDTDEPVYIHTTTMQNHQPYNPETEGQTQLDYYLEGVQDMTENLEAFINSLEELDEPTVVFFVGDHFPCFKGEDSAYNELEINGDNCSSLYVQPYFIWDNYGLNYKNVPTESVSTFYIPYILIDLIDAPKNKLTEVFLEKMKTLPVYSTNYDNTIPDDSELDILTYDIVVGEQYLEETQND